MCLDKCLRELEHQSRLAREDEAKKRQDAGMAPSRIAEEGAAATGDAEGAEPAAECVMPVGHVLLQHKSMSQFVRLTQDEGSKVGSMYWREHNSFPCGWLRYIPASIVMSIHASSLLSGNVHGVCLHSQCMFSPVWQPSVWKDVVENSSRSEILNCVV